MMPSASQHKQPTCCPLLCRSNLLLALPALSQAQQLAALSLLAIGQDHVLGLPTHTEGQHVAFLHALAVWLTCVSAHA